MTQVPKPIVSLFRFIDWPLALPDELDQQIQQTIRGLEEERAMPYVTSIERMGREQGLVEGREEGRTVGREEGKRAAVQHIVARRYGQEPEPLATRITLAEKATLDDLIDRAIIVTRVEDV